MSALRTDGLVMDDAPLLTGCSAGRAMVTALEDGLDDRTAWYHGLAVLHDERRETPGWWRWIPWKQTSTRRRR